MTAETLHPWPPPHNHNRVQPTNTCARCILESAAPAMLQALEELLALHDKFGGVPFNSPAWPPARIAVRAALRKPGEGAL